MKPTVEKLSEMLMENNAIASPFKRKKVKDSYYPNYSEVVGRHVGCEVFGKEAIVFVQYLTKDAYRNIIEVCEKNDIEYEVRNECNDVMITVRYFQGWHWWE